MNSAIATWTEQNDRIDLAPATPIGKAARSDGPPVVHRRLRRTFSEATFCSTRTVVHFLSPQPLCAEPMSLRRRVPRAPWRAVRPPMMHAILGACRHPFACWACSTGPIGSTLWRGERHQTQKSCGQAAAGTSQYSSPALRQTLQITASVGT